MKVGDIFVAGGLPNVTYNPRSNQKLEEKIKDYLDTGYKLLSLTGPTKSGKTVLCKKCVPQSQSLWVAGGQIRKDDDLWDKIISELRLFNSQGESYTKQKGKSSQSEISGSIDAVVAKGGSTITDIESSEEQLSLVKSRETTKRIIAIDGLLQSKKILIIDDFHYIDKGLQTIIIRAIKDPIFNGLRVIIIAVPHRTYDAVRAESEMTGRVCHIGISPWDDVELKLIGKMGFENLNVTCKDDLLNKLAIESWKSPHLMQELCLRICKQNQINENQSTEKDIILENQNAFFKEVVSSISSKVSFEKLARGAVQRVDRIERELKSGKKVDIYEAILHAIAYTGPSLKITYEELRTAIKAVLKTDPPNANEVTQVLSRMDQISKNMVGEPVIDWDKDSRTLYISDPFFSFYLRWEVKEN